MEAVLGIMFLMLVVYSVSRSSEPGRGFTGRFHRCENMSPAEGLEEIALAIAIINEFSGK
ncbi:MAG: hypothetical protein HQK54_18580 [Oligoflexales bacterium]|nr:hypothetical protein [Oligoflexales bacterium]